MGHMGHGSRAQWVSWVMGHSEWPIPCSAGERCKLPRHGPKLNLVHFSLKLWHLVARNLEIFLRINWPNFVQNFQILCRLWKHVNNWKRLIAIASNTVTGLYGSSRGLQLRWMISQDQQYKFLGVHTALAGVVDHWQLCLWSQNWGNVRWCYGVYRYHCRQYKRQFLHVINSCTYLYTHSGFSTDDQKNSLPSAGQHPSYGGCLEVKREYYQNSSVLDCVTQCSQSAAHLCVQFLQVKQIGFVISPPPTNRGPKKHLFWTTSQLHGNFNGIYLRKLGNTI